MPSTAATAATCRVWLDWMLPIETSVSQPCATASAASHSSLRTLLPPNARPEAMSSRLAQTSTPELRGQAWQRVDRRGPEGEQTTRKLAVEIEGHRVTPAWVGARNS